jgi:hypothetical protein
VAARRPPRGTASTAPLAQADSLSTQRPIATWHRSGLVWVTVGVCLAYLGLATAFSLLTPAWENNDEAEHVQYVEYVARHGSPPHISLANGTESHQGPIYYYLAAGWQGLLGIDPFTPNTPDESGLAAGFANGIYVYGHDYTAPQHQQAVWVHELRIVSIVCGLATVLAALATGWLLTGSLAFTGALGATVALWPKFIVVSAAVTNIGLVIALCAWAVPCFVLWERRRSLGWAAATGILLGAAALTEETALPIAGLMLLLMIGFAWRRGDWRAPLLAIGCFAAVAGWWYVHNQIVYGDPLASAATRDYLSQVQGGAPFIRTPASLAPSVLSFGARTLVHSVWYDAGWNQIQLPNVLDLILSALAVVALAAAAVKVRLRGGLVLVVCAVGSLIAWLALLATTNQGEGRYLLVAILAWAFFLIAGSERLLRRPVALWLWPALFVAADAYVVLRWLVPYAHV